MARYADDFVILCRNAAEGEEALERVRTWTTGLPSPYRILLSYRRSVWDDPTR